MLFGLTINFCCLTVECLTKRHLLRVDLLVVGWQRRFNACAFPNYWWISNPAVYASYSLFPILKHSYYHDFSGNSLAENRHSINRLSEYHAIERQEPKWKPFNKIYLLFFSESFSCSFGHSFIFNPIRFFGEANSENLLLKINRRVNSIANHCSWEKMTINMSKSKNGFS